MNAFRFSSASILCLAAALRAEPPAAPPAVPPLPKEHIEMVYHNGDLDSVIFYVKNGRAKPVFLDHRDSLTAFKYLGVIYSADPAMREKGRYYFNQLLNLDPKASITELLPGEKARDVFKEVREEFFELHPGLANKSSQPADAPSADQAAPAPAGIKPRSHALWWWVGGGLALTGAAAATVIAVSDGPTKTYKLHD